jgi:hypothetical protein
VRIQHCGDEKKAVPAFFNPCSSPPALQLLFFTPCSSTPVLHPLFFNPAFFTPFLNDANPPYDPK